MSYLFVMILKRKNMKFTPMISFCLPFILLVFPTVGQSIDNSIEKQYWNQIYKPTYKSPTELPKSTPLRKELFNLLRPSVMKEAKQKVLFSGSLKAFKNWAFFMGNTVDEKGAPVGFPPMNNSDCIALWLRAHSGWVLVDYSLGHSDVFWEIWHYQYGVPKILLGFK